MMLLWIGVFLRRRKVTVVMRRGVEEVRRVAQMDLCRMQALKREVRRTVLVVERKKVLLKTKSSSPQTL